MTQKTFLMLKPDAFYNKLNDILLNELTAKGLHIEVSKVINIDIEVMKTLLEHYHEVIDRMGKPFNFAGKLFNSFYFSEPKKILIMAVSYEEADVIDYTRSLIGKTEPISADPNSLRGKYSKDSYDKAEKDIRLVNNLIHASDSHESANRELNIWKKYLES